MAQNINPGRKPLGDDPIDLSSDDPIGPLAAQPVAEPELAAASSKITTFGQRQRHEDHLDRTPNVTGTGAIHCKVFHCKLREDALDFLETQINDWLDKHPEYEVKFVTSSVGELKTKTQSEPAIFLTVWV